jgi:hypothetical protein
MDNLLTRSIGDTFTDPKSQAELMVVAQGGHKPCDGCHYCWGGECMCDADLLPITGSCWAIDRTDATAVKFVRTPGDAYIVRDHRDVMRHTALPISYHLMTFHGAESNQDAFEQGVRYANEHREHITSPRQEQCFEAGIIAALMQPEPTTERTANGQNPQ